MPRTADWFSKLSKKAQSEYIKAHPNSKYAKGGKTPAVKPTSVAARVLAMSKTYTNTANGLIKKAKEKMALAKTPATKAKWKAEVSRLTSIKQTLKVLGAKGKGISVELKAGTIHSVSPLGGTSSTRRKPTVSTTASKVKAHDAKRAADKNKVIAKTPSAKSKPTKASGLAVVKKDRARRIAVLTSQLAEAKAAKAKARTPASIAKHHQNVLKFQRHLAAADRWPLK